MMWWHKPLNVNEPTLIGGDRAREAVALMWMIQTSSSFASLENAFQNNSLDVQLSSDSHNPADHSEVTQTPSTCPEVGQDHMDQIDHRDDGVALAMEAARRYGISLEKLRELVCGFDPKAWADSSDDGVGYVIVNSSLGVRMLLPRSGNSFKLSTAWVAFVTMVLPLSYGLVHLLVWNYRFPTQTERTLWRISAVAITSCGVGFVALGVLSKGLNKCVLWALRKLHLEKWADPFELGCGYVITIFALVIYVLGTSYFVVEGLRQLFYLPPDAYLLPSWINYFPHFS